MDYLKGIDKRPWILNEKIKVKSFLDLWKRQELNLECNLTSETIDQQFSSMFNVNKEIIDSLKEDLSPDCLTAENDLDWKECIYGNNYPLPNHVKLNSIAAQVNRVEKAESDKKYRQMVNQMLKYKNINFLNNQQDIKKRSPDEPKITELDVVLNVQIFQPMHYSLYVGEHRKHVNPVAEQEFLCLGNQFLAALKDEIICPIDANPAEDCSDDPNKSKPNACEIYTSSFFFIDDCFYNDLRKTTNIDYSQVIMDWAKNPGRGIGELQTAQMESTRFIDLSIRLGQPYVYVHQGNCEHMIVFSELRLFSPQTDSQFLEDYPRLYKTCTRTARRCFMCHINVSKWTVFDNNRLPNNPVFFCQQCFITFNYDSDKKKIGNFKAFPYLDKSAIL